jgi:hypothetical protein
MVNLLMFTHILTKCTVQEANTNTYYSTGLQIFLVLQTETVSLSSTIRVNLSSSTYHCFSLFIHRYGSLTSLYTVTASEYI